MQQPTADFLRNLRRTIVSATDWAYSVTDCKQPPPVVFIAGGCIRDLLLNRSVSDIDVFITPAEPMPARTWDELTETVAYLLGQTRVAQTAADKAGVLSAPRAAFKPHHPVGRVEVDGDPNYEGVSAISAVHQINTHPHPVQLILDATPEPWTRFDFRICQAWLGPKGKFETAPGFWTDAHSQRLTQLSETKPARIAKLQAKFPSWRITGRPQPLSPWGFPF